MQKELEWLRSLWFNDEKHFNYQDAALPIATLWPWNGSNGSVSVTNTWELQWHHSIIFFIQNHVKHPSAPGLHAGAKRRHDQHFARMRLFPAWLSHVESLDGMLGIRPPQPLCSLKEMQYTNTSQQRIQEYTGYRAAFIFLEKLACPGDSHVPLLYCLGYSNTGCTVMGSNPAGIECARSFQLRCQLQCPNRCSNI